MSEWSKFVEIRLVRYDTALAYSGAFCSLPNNARPKLDISHEFGGVTWNWRGPDMLGIPEQSLLLVLLELAQEQSNASEHGARVAAMEDELYPSNESQRPPLASINVSFAELGRRLGRKEDGGSASRQIRKELERLCEVTVWRREVEGKQMSSRLLAWRRSDSAGVDVVLNWRLAETLFGGQYSPVSLGQRLLLSTDCARALHCSLSVYIRPGCSMQFKLDTLATFVWLDDEVADGTRRRRRQAIRDALEQLVAVRGWTVKQLPNTPGTVRIVRWSEDWEPKARSRVGTVRAKAGRGPDGHKDDLSRPPGKPAPNAAVDISALCV
ncbi:replication protein C, IncQ-type [Burkholderia sp. JPY481]